MMNFQIVQDQEHAGGNQAAAGQYDFCNQQPGQGSFYALSGQHEPAASDPLHDVSDPPALHVVRQGSLVYGFVVLLLDVLTCPS